MIKVICDVCSKELDEMGGLLFSPPDAAYDDDNNMSLVCTKTHICADCFPKLLDFIQEEKRNLLNNKKKASPHHPCKYNCGKDLVYKRKIEGKKGSTGWFEVDDPSGEIEHTYKRCFDLQKVQKEQQQKRNEEKTYKNLL